MSPATLRQAAGQVLVVGLEGPQLSPLESAWLRFLRPGGVILFRRNIETAAQTYELTRSAMRAAEQPLLRCIDVEGGTVDRLRDLIAPMPSPFAVAATNKTALFKRHGSLIGQEVRMLGLNTTFAPVLDLRTPASEKVMTTRVVAGDPAYYGKHFLVGLAQHGILGCGKHFPGLGSGAVDSHYATPLISKSLDQLWKEDLLPYRQLVKQLPMVMVSHAAYSSASNEPASVSTYWITDILARKMGYRGLIVSDDMEMGGILKYMGMADAAVGSLAAGIHAVEVCRDPALVFAAYEGILREAEKSPAFARLLRRAAAKVQSITPARETPVPGDAAVAKMRTAIERFTAQVAKATAA